MYGYGTFCELSLFISRKQAELNQVCAALELNKLCKMYVSMQETVTSVMSWAQMQNQWQLSNKSEWYSLKVSHAAET